MRTVLRVAGRELTEAWRERTAPAFAAVILGLSLVSLAVGWAQYGRLAADQQAAQAGARSQWLAQGEKNPHSAGHFGSFAFKTLPPLALLDRGLDRYLGQWIRLETHAQHGAAGRPAHDTAALVRVGELTPGFLLQWLGPLFVILMGFGAVSREREQGTFTLLLAQGVRPWRLAAGKGLAHAAVVAVLLLPLGLVGVAALVHPAFAADAPARVGLLILTFGAYLLSFSMFAIGVSGLVRSSGLALTILLALWLGVCVLVPRLTVLAAEARHPLPSSIQFLADYQAARGNQYIYGFSGYDSFNDVFERVQQQLFEEYGVTTAANLPVNTFGYALEATEREGQRAYDDTWGHLQRIVDRQEAVHRTAHVLSPAMAVQAFTMGLSGTGYGEHRHFVDQAEGYRRVMMHTLNMDLAHNTHDPDYDVQRRNTGDYTRGADLWASIPDYQYVPRALPEVLALHRAEMAGLGVWLLAAGLCMSAGFVRACREP